MLLANKEREEGASGVGAAAPEAKRKLNVLGVSGRAPRGALPPCLPPQRPRAGRPARAAGADPAARCAADGGAARHVRTDRRERGAHQPCMHRPSCAPGPGAPAPAERRGR